MKLKTGLFSILGACALMGGIYAGLMSSKYAVEAKADGTITTYLDLGKSGDTWESKANAKIYVHWWGSEVPSTMTGHQMTKNEFGLYVYEVPSDATGMLFNVNGWSGDCQTANLTPNSERTLWTINTNYTNGSSQSADSQLYSEKTIYLLDKFGFLSEASRYAHVWRNGYKAGTSWTSNVKQGEELVADSGGIYKLTVPAVMDKIKFNSNDSNGTADLSIEGQAFVLDGNWNGSWVSLEAARFIDENMRFRSIPTSNVDQGTDCKGFYSAVKAAYNALSSNEIREEVLRVSDVQARLSAWAEANGDELDTTTFTPLSAGYIANPLSSPEANKNAALIAAISGSVAILALGGFFLLRRKHEN